MPTAFVVLDGDDGFCRESEVVAAHGETWPCPRRVLVVDDAAHDGIAFLAAVPILRAPDVPGGVLCLSDRVAHVLDADQRARLDDLSRLASAHLLAQNDFRALTERAALYRTLAENSADTLVRGGTDGLRSYLSPSLSGLLGFHPDELIGTPAKDFVHPDDLPEFAAAMRELREGRVDSFTTEHRHHHKDGSWVWLEAFVQVTRDAAGHQDGYVASVRGTTRRKEIEARLEHSATHDALTGLPNRALLYERLNRLLAQGAGFAVLCLDLDGFKQVNDRLGHGAGDLVLQAVAERLRTCLPPEDLVARRGGDEFVAILLGPDVRPESRITLAENMIRVVSAPIHLDGVSIAIGLSVGIAFAPGAGADADAVLRAADAALYEAKHSGRNRVSVFG